MVKVAGMDSSDLLQATLDRVALEEGMEIVDGISDWSEMQKIIALLRTQESQSASASYLLGHLWVRYGKWDDAYNCFLTSANFGINSANYRAGQIIRDHGAEVESKTKVSASDLFSLAARNGHIWSRQIILKENAKLSFVRRLIWWMHRFLFLPLKLLGAAVFNIRHDDMRY